MKRHSFVLFPALVVSSLATTSQAFDRYVVSDNGTTASAMDDRFWMVEDLNGDGAFNDVGEVTLFYDETVGGIVIETVNGVGVGPDGSVYGCDSTQDIVVRVRDQNGDGDGNDAGEASVFFHSLTNAMGLNMSAALNVFADANGVVWVANSGTAGVDDTIMRLEDLNADGDADDLNEARNYFTPAPGGATADSIPTGVIVGHDGAVYYSENSTGAIPRGIYRLEDTNANGVIDAPAEVTPYLIPPPGPSTAFHWCVKMDAQGYYYLNDTGNERIWRGKDLDNSGSIDPTTEAVIWYTPGVASNMWQICFAANGDAFVVEDQTPDRILRLVDTDANGTIAGGEVTEVYSDLVSLTNILSPRSIDRMVPGINGGPFCAGDGVDANVTTACPCSNFGAVGRGCANSTNAAGARLAATGTSNPDTAVLQGSGMPATVSCIYLQGDALDDTTFGDGVRCAGGSLLRLRTKTNVGGASSFPDSVETVTLSQRGGVTPGSGVVRYYQTYYRNAAAAFCPPETFNVTNGIRITW
ncbi:MAG: hypothetical protein IPJ77_12080 [Planctomycetes bacterium]|nr:hypothetical protein [Planctomycetota bacterium]